ncbi:hypothetical protein LG632_28835 [Streptomyces sp. SMC 277]|uniref:Aromatic ring-opening dioxygenase LigA n=1 Tax=Streptomyces antimicrobicus TaxID=2883108 RepID=A0ABS8BFE2_9ACTN|nr:hypothetical protein [Streptomyces antimicrobicus]
MAIAATLPYIALKLAWLSGSQLGIPEGSRLRESGPLLQAVNGVTVLMDVALVVLVLALTRPWGRRIPSWLLLVPAGVASGLLTPILTAFPTQRLLRLLGAGTDPAAAAAPREPFLDDWVFTVVYTGFSVQALALAGLFVPYARERWGHLWRRRTGMSGGPRALAVAAAVGALVAAGTQIHWALGGTAGLTPALAADRTTDTAIVGTVHALCALAAAAGALLLAFGWARSARTPLALAWVGGAEALSWGGWLFLAALIPGSDPAKEATATLQLTYAGQMITGVLAAAVLTRFLTARRTG